MLLSNFVDIIVNPEQLPKDSLGKTKQNHLSKILTRDAGVKQLTNLKVVFCRTFR